MKIHTYHTVPANLTIPIEILSKPDTFFTEFFSEFHSPEAHSTLDWMFKALYQVKSRKKYRKNATNILYFYERLIMLLEVTWLVALHDNTERKANLPTVDDQSVLLNPSLFVPKHQHRAAWSYLPRHLEANEFMQPYIVLPKVFKQLSLDEWKSQLNLLLHNSLSKYPIDFSSNDIEVFTINTFLHKLIDACYLIYMREFASFQEHSSAIDKNSLPKDGDQIVNENTIENGTD